MNVFLHVSPEISLSPSTSASGEHTSSGAPANCEAVGTPSGRVRSPLNSSSFEKARPAGLPGASRVDANWPGNTGATGMNSSSSFWGEKFAPGERISPEKVAHQTTLELAAEFSAVVIDLSEKRLSRAAGASQETAKCWKSGRALPNGKHLLALIAEFPQIRAWADRRTGGIANPRSFSETMALVEQLMTGNSPEGRAIRARMAELLQEGRS